MKKLKKMIILCVISIILIGYFIYENINNNETEHENSTILDFSEDFNEEIKYIVLHITGEIVNPRNYKNSRKFKTSRCN